MSQLSQSLYYSQYILIPSEPKVLCLVYLEVQEYEPDMRESSLMVTGQSDLSQQPKGLTLAAGVLHDQNAHSLFCAHCTAHSCHVLRVSEQ